MNSSQPQLAQINIARMVAPLSDPRMAEFVAQLAEINAKLLVNMSVWESVENLHAYTYRSGHALRGDRREPRTDTRERVEALCLKARRCVAHDLSRACAHAPLRATVAA